MGDKIEYNGSTYQTLKKVREGTLCVMQENEAGKSIIISGKRRIMGQKTKEGSLLYVYESGTGNDDDYNGVFSVDAGKETVNHKIVRSVDFLCAPECDIVVRYDGREWQVIEATTAKVIHTLQGVKIFASHKGISQAIQFTNPDGTLGLYDISTKSNLYDSVQDIERSAHFLTVLRDDNSMVLLPL